MESSLLSLLLEYKNKLFDESFIYECANILYNEDDYTSYLKEIKIYDGIDESDAIAAFVREEDELIVSFDDCIDDANQMMEYLTKSSKEERLMLANASIMHVLMHEFVHIDQEKQEMEDNNSFEKELLIRCDAFLLLSEDNKYSNYIIKHGINPLELLKITNYAYKLSRNNYLISPTERLAQIYAYKDLFKIIRPIKKDYTSLYNFFIREYIWEYLNGYEVIDGLIQGPTSKYFQNLGLDIFFKELSTYIENNQEYFDYSNRLLYGLELTNDELNNLSKRYENISSKCKRLGIK